MAEWIMCWILKNTELHIVLQPGAMQHLMDCPYLILVVEYLEYLEYIVHFLLSCLLLLVWYCLVLLWVGIFKNLSQCGHYHDTDWFLNPEPSLKVPSWFSCQEQQFLPSSIIHQAFFHSIMAVERGEIYPDLLILCI